MNSRKSFFLKGQAKFSQLDKSSCFEKTLGYFLPLNNTLSSQEDITP